MTLPTMGYLRGIFKVSSGYLGLDGQKITTKRNRNKRYVFCAGMSGCRITLLHYYRKKSVECCICAIFFVPLQRLLCFDDYGRSFEILHPCFMCAVGDMVGDAPIL